MRVSPFLGEVDVFFRQDGQEVVWSTVRVCGKKTLKINMTNWQIICSIRMSSDTVTRAQARGTRG